MKDHTDLANDPLLTHVPNVDGAKFLPPCRLIRRIARGGMSVVYMAHHVNFKVDVAVKVLDPRLVEDDSFVTRFKREAHMAVTITHENLIRVFDVNEAHGLHYIVMEYVSGETARNRVERKGRLAVAEALRIVQGAAAGLGAAHTVGIVHRDVKPDNLLIAADGRVKVADLGLARPRVSDSMTRTQVVMGTPRYMAPEQWTDVRRVLASTDVWALGATLYFLLAGEDPNKGDGEARVPDIRGKREDVPAPVLELLARCVHPDPTKRFVDCRELGQALRHLITEEGDLAHAAESQHSSEPLVSPPPSLGRKPSSGKQLTTRRGGRTWWLAATALLIGGGVGLWAALGQMPVVADSRWQQLLAGASIPDGPNAVPGFRRHIGDVLAKDGPLAALDKANAAVAAGQTTFRADSDRLTESVRSALQGAKVTHTPPDANRSFQVTVTAPEWAVVDIDGKRATGPHGTFTATITVDADQRKTVATTVSAGGVEFKPPVFEVLIDKTGPAIHADPITVGDSATVEVLATVTDMLSTVVAVTCDGVRLLPRAGSQYAGSVSVTGATTELTILARDQLGNQSERKVEVLRPAAPPPTPPAPDTAPPVMTLTTLQIAYLPVVELDGTVNERSTLEVDGLSIPVDGKFTVLLQCLPDRELRVVARDEANNESAAATVKILAAPPVKFDKLDIADGSIGNGKLAITGVVSSPASRVVVGDIQQATDRDRRFAVQIPIPGQSGVEVLASTAAAEWQSTGVHFVDADGQVQVGSELADRCIGENNLVVGDRVTKCNGSAVASVQQLLAQLQRARNQPVQFTVVRNGVEQIVSQPWLPPLLGRGTLTLPRGAWYDPKATSCNDMFGFVVGAPCAPVGKFAEVTRDRGLAWIDLHGQSFQVVLASLAVSFIKLEKRAALPPSLLNRRLNWGMSQPEALAQMKPAEPKKQRPAGALPGMLEYELDGTNLILRFDAGAPGSLSSIEVRKVE